MIKKIFLFIFIIVAFFSCSDNITINKTDLEKYAWLSPFLIDGEKIKGYHNMDLGTLLFSYEFQRENYSDAIAKFDSIAVAEEWEILRQGELKREYSKIVSEEKKDGGNILIKIEIDSLQSKVLFDIR